MHKQSLVIGGTGMLAEASRYVQSISKDCLIVGRNHNRLRALQQENTKLFEASYTDAKFLPELIDQFESSPQLCLLWMHNSGQENLLKIGEWLSQQASASQLFHVRGSASNNPEKLTNPLRDFLKNSTVSYHEIILGFVIEGGHRRWLTHGEISQGSIEAIKLGQEKFIIGQTEDW